MREGEVTLAKCNRCAKLCGERTFSEGPNIGRKA